jgi:HK97 family phage prohead protease
MPYFIQKTSNGWNTVKDDGTILGKHPDKASAVKQMVAVSLAEKIAPGGELKRAVSEGTFTPPKDVQDTAKRALKWIADGLAGSGFTAVGKSRANQLAEGKPVSAATVNRMLSFFARHSVDSKATGFNEGEDGFPSAGRVSWDAWGGDAGQRWVSSLDKKEKTMNKRDMGTAIGITDMDDTLVVNGELHQDYYAWLDHQPVSLYVVTGRNDSDRESTMAELDRLGVEYQELIMKPDAVTDSNSWKGEEAANLIADGYNILFAVDNNPEARAAYQTAGVEQVYDPKNLPQEAATATRDAMDDVVETPAEEAAEPTKEYLASELRELLGNVVATKFLAHGAHWNIKGVNFYQFHKFFQKIYEDYDSMIDPLAENIRKLDVDAPFTLPQFVADTEIDATFIGGDPVQLSLAIYKANEILLGDVVEVQDCADDLNQQGIFNFLADLQDRFSLWHWQLGAVIGDDLRNAYAVDVEEVDEPTPTGEPISNMPAKDIGEQDMQMDAIRFIDPMQVAELAKRGKRADKGLERRQIIRDLEIRAEGDGMTLRGYAAVFNSPSQPLPFTETIAPGAFTDSLKSRNDIKLLWNHDTGTVLGSTRAGTLKVSEDGHGLLIEAQLPDTQAGRDAATLIKRGDVNAFSFGFRVPAGGDEWPSPDQRILKRVNIHEASVVSWPAYEATTGTASVRSMTDLESKIHALAELRGVSAEELTEALLALESGQELTERQGELLTDTLDKVLKKDEKVTNPQNLLDLKKKQLDLLMQKV